MISFLVLAVRNSQFATFCLFPPSLIHCTHFGWWSLIDLTIDILSFLGLEVSQTGRRLDLHRCWEIVVSEWINIFFSLAGFTSEICGSWYPSVQMLRNILLTIKLTYTVVFLLITSGTCANKMPPPNSCVTVDAGCLCFIQLFTVMLQVCHFIVQP